ncbi:YggS family pyridoxal phosphate-dependent enzyme [Flavobacterium sp. CYK-55]|uniref:YggS family pyridoxal phosphate-dependent enzyme n=1 Tax=Flavobacterium sp. CYK-55 TaxID=2835529 RepID=UPI001BCB912A|nr:YggS family pyridoxal phosphate-dependent enzyme [Flavobacterium sp. CYK-55]MBS7786741.1 YggS family pyridoxal phosphate-dependent enzyme [Flavobacterium sp. CYK-55]
MSIAQNLQKIKAELPEQVTLVAVSKTKPTEDILEAYQAGQRIFGENKVQEMTDKWEQLPKDIQWHMIGHLQTNKVKYLIPYVQLIHGVDSLKLLQEMNRQAARFNKKINCLLQVHIAQEDTKFGFDAAEIEDLLHSEEFKSFQNIEVRGFMGMASFTDNETQIKAEFNSLKNIFDQYKNLTLPHFKAEILSMGMSGDYALAIECGSNMVRIGSSIFGSR